jgi:hypothetical protein
MSDAPRTYTVRRLNPFLGVVAVVATPGARALSDDGATWQLQVLAERPEHTWGSTNRGAGVRQFFRFGNWNRDTGMTRVPVNPVLDIGAMLEAARGLVAALEEQIERLPFPLADRFEQWLLDRHDRPLALLASTVERAVIDEVADAHWQATLPAGTPFVSPSLEAEGVPLQTVRSRRHHADLLEAGLHGVCDRPPRRQWFERQPDGSGIGLDEHSPGGVGGRHLAAQAFPVTGVRTEWADPRMARLVGEYLDWTAARLLTLPDLPDTTRERLEQAARRQALQVDALHRLYPRIVQPGWIDAARIEARLRHAAEQP